MQELDDDLGAWADQHLALSSLLGVVDGIERIVEDTCLDHNCGGEILNSIMGGEVSAGKGKISMSACERKECSWIRGSSAHVKRLQRRLIIGEWLP